MQERAERVADVPGRGYAGVDEFASCHDDPHAGAAVDLEGVVAARGRQS